MKGNPVFSEQKRDFEKTCRRRILAGKMIFLAGALAVLAALLYERAAPLSHTAGKGTAEFYLVTGAALMAASLVKIGRTRRYLLNPELGKGKWLEENDERNRLIGLRCWAFSGYALFLLLYAGILISGFMNMTVARVLMAVTVVFALLLGIFRVVISRNM